ncbi:protein YgfX [Herbaspirillum lusitanum]|uniref:protein YgfX n=1 Tax=Herbaspirillum lusitanum TaxID=213312 RepID=UPI0003721A37|nr:protein YgfX [Herbaspirillum lusitanum]MCW5299820.1 flagellar hook-length control protein [Herbaspirillum lusitanum]
MSIAVSADIKPSRLLLIMMAAAAVAVAFIGVIFAFALVGQLSFVFRMSLAGACIIAAALAFWLMLRNRTTVWLHISGTGQIRLVEHHAVVRAKPGSQVMSGGLAQLLAGSTVWPNLLLLRLRLENGRIRTIPVLPDSVPKETFRALQVACRWVASHNNDA